MKPVDQTLFGEQGNCLQACVASLLELPLEEVPHFVAMPGSYFRHFERFFHPRGLQPVAFPLQSLRWGVMDSYYLAWGISSRGIRHSVVMLNGKMVHDPHPERTGLEKAEDVVIFVAKFTS